MNLKLKLTWKEAPKDTFGKPLPAMAELDETIFERVAPTPGEITDKLQQRFNGEIETFSQVSDEDFAKWQEEQKKAKDVAAGRIEFDDPAN